MQNLHDRQTCIQPNEVRQLQWPHGHIRTVLHYIVDILLSAYTSLKTDDGFVDIRHQYSICEEARRICGLGWDLAHPLYELDGCVDCGLGRLKTAYDFDTFLHRNRVHEVGAHDP